jgi:signal transduction histidine kinase
MSCGEELAEHKPIIFSLSVAGTPQLLNPIVFDEGYRIGREVLTNAFQHSNASKIDAEIIYDRASFRLRVRDDGCGMDQSILNNGRPGHWGLAGIRERADNIGSHLNISSKPGCGTEFELIIPARIAYQTRCDKSGWHWVKRIRNLRDPRTCRAVTIETYNSHSAAGDVT